MSDSDLTVLKSSISSFSLSGPKYAGKWKIDPYFSIAVIKKPNWFHRKMVHLMFGWEWVDDNAT